MVVSLPSTARHGFKSRPGTAEGSFVNTKEYCNPRENSHQYKTQKNTFLKVVLLISIGFNADPDRTQEAKPCKSMRIRIRSYLNKVIQKFEFLHKIKHIGT